MARRISRAIRLPALARRVGSTRTLGAGIVVGYAIDASTLGTTNRRVGLMSIDLQQLNDKAVPIFEADCSIDNAVNIPCLNRIILATYTPSGPDAVGIPTADVPGFLWFTPETAPYNYGGQ